MFTSFYNYIQIRSHPSTNVSPTTPILLLKPNHGSNVTSGAGWLFIAYAITTVAQTRQSRANCKIVKQIVKS